MHIREEEGEKENIHKKWSSVQRGKGPSEPMETWGLVPTKFWFIRSSFFRQCTVFRKAYILSGSGFHEFLYSIIESFKKIREIAEFIPNQLRFHEKNFS